jgi:hypothetical protein
MIETVEKQLAEQGVLKAMAEQQITAAQMRFVSLTRGERVAGDDDAPARMVALAILAGQLRPPRNGR